MKFRFHSCRLTEGQRTVYFCSLSFNAVSFQEKLRKSGLKYSKELLSALALFSIHPHFHEKELGQRVIIYHFLIKKNRRRSVQAGRNQQTGIPEH